MPVFDAKRLFSAESMILLDIFNRAGEGFYIPDFQREYTWEEDNIDQLFGDIITGVSSFKEDRESVMFLGSLIFVTLGDTTELSPIDSRAIPASIQIVVDGQQRLATLALIAINLSAKIKQSLNNLTQISFYDRLQERANAVLEKLRYLYSVDLQRGNPRYKPKIIRSEIDKWTYIGEDGYRDEISRYIASYIKTEDERAAFSEIKHGRVKRNLSLINEYLTKVEKAHIPDFEHFGIIPSGISISGTHLFEFVFTFKDENDPIADILSNPDVDLQSNESACFTLAQLILLSDYLLQRTIITRLEPANQDWGFDMFQALNTTGTPLTTIETFRPLVMKAESQSGQTWQNSPSYQSFQRIMKTFEDVDKHQNKISLTNELVLASALVYSGKQISNKFSEQYKWIKNTFASIPTIEQKREFVGIIGDVADFYEGAWRLRNAQIPDIISGLENNEDREFASFLISYLRDANSKLSAPILASYYQQIISEEDEKGKDFVVVLKACVAFFTLWRSAFGTSGLDDVYRHFLTGYNGTVNVDPHCITNRQDSLESTALIQYFKRVLEVKGIGEKSSWQSRAEKGLTYDNVKVVCRFCLFLSTKDCIPDDQNPGLMKIGSGGTTTDIFILRYWKSKDLKTIEHVAPQHKPDGSSWDDELYTQGYINSIGNLILLPKEINDAASNKEWRYKKLYYRLLGERDPNILNDLESEANNLGIQFSNPLKKRLQKAQFFAHIEPIKQKPDDSPWDLDFVKQRTERITDIVWERLAPWLDLYGE